MDRIHPTQFLKFAAWVPALLWYRVIWSFSAQTAAVSGDLSDRLLWRLLEWGSTVFRLQSQEGQLAIVEFLSFYERKAAHMFLYFVLAGLLLLPLWVMCKRPGRRAGVALALCALLAALDEFHQTFVPGRSGELRDVAVDLTGSICFLLVGWLVRSLVSGWKARRILREMV